MEELKGGDLTDLNNAAKHESAGEDQRSAEVNHEEKSEEDHPPLNDKNHGENKANGENKDNNDNTSHDDSKDHDDNANNDITSHDHTIAPETDPIAPSPDVDTSSGETHLDETDDGDGDDADGMGESEDECEEPRLCHEGCKHAGVETNSKLVKCRICMVRHHIDCVGIEQKDLKKVGFWSCYICRKMSQNVKGLQSSMKLMLSLVENMSASMMPFLQQKQETPERCLLAEALTNMTEECDKLREQNIRLQQQLEDKRQNKIPDPDDSVEIVDSSDSESDPDEDDVEIHGHLIIGDSLIQNVEPTLDGITVACRRGAKIHDLTKKLKQEGRKFRQITIVCGTNDISTKMSVNKICEKFRDLLEIAKKRSKNITVSSIPPRLDEAVTDAKLKEMNKFMEIITKESDAHYVNNDLNFRFKSDIPDVSLLQIDGLHLSHTGVSRLLQNLTLEGGVKCNLPDISKAAAKKPDVKPEVEPKKRVHTRSRKGVTVFLGRDSLFSNLHMDTPIHIEGRLYNCNEQFYTHSMATFFNDNDATTKSLTIDDPYQLIKLQKEIANVDRNKWQPEAERVLYLANIAKYTQNLKAREALLNTGNNTIGEASFSRTWGIGMSIGDVRALDTNRWNGKNIMGNMLMSIRDTLHPNTNNRTHSPRNQSYATQIKACWYCGEENHMSRNCRHGQKIECNYCLNLGHKAKFCHLN